MKVFRLYHEELVFTKKQSFLVIQMKFQVKNSDSNYSLNKNPNPIFRKSFNYT